MAEYFFDIIWLALFTNAGQAIFWLWREGKIIDQYSRSLSEFAQKLHRLETTHNALKWRAMKYDKEI